MNATSERYVDALERELRAAHQRLGAAERVGSPAPSTPWWRPRFVAPVAAGLAAVVLAVTLFAVGDEATPAAALAVTSTTDALVIDVLDAVADRDAEARRLAASGLEVRFDEAPVPDHLVDRVVLATLGGDLTAASVEAEAGPRGLDRIRLPAGYAGGVVLVIGRPATDDEPYEQSTPDPELCREIGGQAFGVVRDRLTDNGRISLRLMAAGADDGTTSVDPTEADGLSVVDIIEVDRRTRLVVVGPDPEVAGANGCASLAGR